MSYFVKYKGYQSNSPNQGGSRWQQTRGRGHQQRGAVGGRQQKDRGHQQEASGQQQGSWGQQQRGGGQQQGSWDQQQEKGWGHQQEAWGQQQQGVLGQQQGVWGQQQRDGPQQKVWGQQQGRRDQQQRGGSQQQGTWDQHQGYCDQQQQGGNQQQEGSDLFTNILCHYCGNDILTGELCAQNNKEYHRKCLREHIPYCDRAVERFRVLGQYDNVLSIAIHVKVIYGSKEKDPNIRKKRDKRSVKVTEFLNYVSALRNSGSGILLIHLVGLHAEDNFTGSFDELVDVKLQGLINDGSLFTDVYKKQRLSQHSDEKLKTFTDIVTLYVEETDVLITSDFKSKVALDDCIVDIPDLTFLKLLKAAKKFEGDKFHLINVKYMYAEHLCSLQESRHIQTKAYFPPKAQDDKLVLDILDKSRLAEYISAFSKIEDGGSFLLGFMENANGFYDYRSKILTVKPVIIKNFQLVDELINERVSETCLVCDYDGEKKTNEKLVNVHFIPTKDKTGCVIHVSVRPVSGVVFYDRNGPAAYRVNTKHSEHSEHEPIRRMTVPEWFEAFRKRV